MRANQLRLWFASMAYVLVAALRASWPIREGSPPRCGMQRLHIDSRRWPSSFRTQHSFALNAAV
jgi:hypothetical protein